MNLTQLKLFVRRQIIRKSVMIMGFSLCFVLFFIACHTKKSNLKEDAYLFNQDLGVEVVGLPKFLAEKTGDDIDIPLNIQQSKHCRENQEWWFGKWTIDVPKNLAMMQLNEKEKAEFKAFLEVLSQDFLIEINRRTSLNYYALGEKSLNIPYLPSDNDPRFEIHAKDRSNQEFHLLCLENGNVWWKNANRDGIFLRLENSKQSSLKDD